MRLQKFLRDRGLGSRRKCDVFVQSGIISINGEIVTSPTAMLKDGDQVEISGKTYLYQSNTLIQHVYLKYYKPVQTLSSHHDPQDRRLFTEDLKDKPKLKNKKLLYAGRLDYNSRGLMLLSTDGDFIQAMSHPSMGKDKEYEVKTMEEIDYQALTSLSTGFKFGEIEYAPFQVRAITQNKCSMILTEGKNQEIRNIFRALNNQVVDLFRLRIGNHSIGNLKAGEYSFFNYGANQ